MLPNQPSNANRRPMLTIIAATEYELAGLRRAWPVAGEEVELQVVGIGKQAAQGAVRRLLTRRTDGRQTGELLLLGLAGGLDPALRTGDLCLPFRYLREARDATAGFIEPDDAMYAQAVTALQAAAMDWRGGDALTVSRVSAAAAAKAAQFRQYQAATVNMEDYWIAQTAARYAVPFLAVRAILDTAGQGLPHYLLQLSDAGPGQIAKAVAGHPRRISELARLSYDAARARQSLTKFALAFLELRAAARAAEA